MGTRTGIYAFALFIKLPSLKLTPRESCDFIILLVSSNKVGINLRAIVIIIATSCAGNPIFLNGVISDSIPFDSFEGLVVRVRIAAYKTRYKSLKDIVRAPMQPSFVIEKGPIENKLFPLVPKRCIKIVNITKNRMGFTDRKTALNGTFERYIKINKNNPQKGIVRTDLKIKISAIRNMVTTILQRGSKSCIKDFAGIN